MKWEYLVKEFKSRHYGYEVDGERFSYYTEALNHFGREGWELVTVNNHLQHTFKRQIIR